MTNIEKYSPKAAMLQDVEVIEAAVRRLVSVTSVKAFFKLRHGHTEFCASLTRVVAELWETKGIIQRTGKD